MKTISESVTPGTVQGSTRNWLRFEDLALFILSIFFYAHSGASWWQFGLFLLAPDLSIAAYWLGPRAGAALYNAAHSYAGPAVLAGLALADSFPRLYPWVLIWSTHISMDRALGYGLKYPQSFKTTHLGLLGGEKRP
jgi:Domain of unknown function (DUF4260)